MGWVVKRIRGRQYLYYQRRIAGKVVTKYIGPLDLIARVYLEWKKQSKDGAGAGIRTRAGLRQRILSPPPLSWLGHPRRQF